MERFTLSKESAIGPYMGTDPNGAWCHWDAVKARIAALEAQVKALTAERDAQAEAVKSACRMAYRASYLGFDHAWGDSQISCIKNKIVRETMQDIARAAVERGAEG